MYQDFWDTGVLPFVARDGGFGSEAFGSAVSFNIAVGGRYNFNEKDCRISGRRTHPFWKPKCRSHH